MMSSRGKNELCQICGGPLQGNRRRWLFGGHNKKTGQPQTLTESLKGGSLSCSSRSSLWGSTLSLSSSASLSRSHSSLSSPSKGVDLLSVLTHILGQSVPRNSDHGEFVCGKCVCVLERVFKFDSVIARVRVLSSERLQKLMQERDKIRQWVRQNYRQRHPDFQSRGSTSEEEGDTESSLSGYREMLKENMALSEYECWSEKWDTCLYFIRTGKRCRKGKGCEGCDSVRVSDSDYESICGVPRRLPFQPFSPLALSRDKSQSMPLHWQKVPFINSSPASLAGSRLSLRASGAESIQSLDSLDDNDPFDSPGDHSVNLVLKELRNIEGKPVTSPSGSRIPVLDKKGGRLSGKTEEMASPSVNRVLIFGEVLNVGEDVDEEDGDVRTELRDEFMPLHPESTFGRVHHVVRHLRGQLNQAVFRIRTLEAELDDARQGKPTEVNGADWTSLVEEEDSSSLLQSLSHSLHSRERLIQECMGLIRRLCVEEGAGIQLTEKLQENLKEILSDNKAALKTLRMEMTEKEKSMEKEIEALRKAGRDREGDLNTLTTVLHCNQDIIKDLQVTLAEKEHLQKEMEKEMEVWRQRDQALTAVQQEKNALIHYLKEELQNHKKSMQASSGSLTGQELVEVSKTSVLEEREVNSATLCQEVTKLTTALQEYQDMVQNQQERYSNTASSLRAELRDTRQELREKEREKKEAERSWQNIRDDTQKENRKLRDSLDKRDKLIEQILLDAEERDHLSRELQLNLGNKHRPLAAVKHTL